MKKHQRVIVAIIVIVIFLDLAEFLAGWNNPK
jgi:hypothetical protein